MRIKADATRPQRASRLCLPVKCQAACTVMIKIHLNKDQQPVKWASVVTQRRGGFFFVQMKPRKRRHARDDAPSLRHSEDFMS